MQACTQLPAGLSRARCAVALHDTSHFGHRPLKPVIYHDVVGNPVPDFFFRLGFGEALSDDHVVVSPRPESSFLGLPVGWLHEDQHGIRILFPDLDGALDIDFKYNVAARGGCRHRGPIEVAEHLRVFDEALFFDVATKCFSVYEAVGVRRFVLASVAGGPGATQPQGFVVTDQGVDDRSLAGT